MIHKYFKINPFNIIIGVVTLLHFFFFFKTLKDYIIIKNSYSFIIKKIEELDNPDSESYKFQEKEILLLSRNIKNLEKIIELLILKKKDNNKFLFSENKKKNRKIISKKNRIRRPRNQHTKKIMPSNSEDNKIIEAISIDLIFPIKKGNFWISSKYGPRYNKKKGDKGFHHGIDLAANKGTPVYPATEGYVVFASWNKGFGKCILVEHENQIKTRYAHLSKINVRVGEKVSIKKCIGLVGATGNVRGSHGKAGYHLHFEIYLGKKRVDPLNYLHY